MRAAQLERAGERLLHGDLLVEREADQQRERVLGEEAVGVGVAGEREVVGRDGQTHARIVRAVRRRRARAADYDRPMTNPAPFADTRGTLAIRAGRLLDVETGETLARPRAPRPRRADRGGRRARTTASRTARRSSTSSGLTVLPGLIDTHSHLVGEIQTAGVPATTTTGAQDALLSVRNARVTLEAGFTTVRDLGPVPRLRGHARCATRSTRASSRGRGCSAPAPSSPCPGAAATSSGLAPDIAPARRSCASAWSRRRPRSATGSGGC